MIINNDNLLNNIKTDIRKSKLQAGIEVNKVMLQLYWRSGKTISELEKEGYTIKQITSWLAKDLEKVYSTTISFSQKNFEYMQRFYIAYPDVEILQELLAQLTWGYHIVLLDLVNTYEERIYYVRLVVEHGWGVEKLIEVIKSGRN